MATSKELEELLVQTIAGIELLSTILIKASRAQDVAEAVNPSIESQLVLKELGRLSRIL